MFSAISSGLTVLASVKSTITGDTGCALQLSHCRQEGEERLFSMREIKQHCDAQSCWVVINNAVYDITDFLYEHPGGLDIMLEHAGTDCTGAFQDKGHSTWAVKLLQKYKIGMLPPAERIWL